MVRAPFRAALIALAVALELEHVAPGARGDRVGHGLGHEQPCLVGAFAGPGAESRDRDGLGGGRVRQQHHRD